MEKKVIIGLAGPKQSGKTSAAYHLEKSGFYQMSFADPIRKMLSTVFLGCGYTPDEIEIALYKSDEKEKPLYPFYKSPREMMQTLGTEWGRNCVDPDIWVSIAKERIARIECDYIVFDDVRFENEAAMIRGLGGLIIHIDRDIVRLDAHASELGISDHEDDVFVDNDGSLNDFLLDVYAMVAGHVGHEIKPVNRFESLII